MKTAMTGMGCIVIIVLSVMINLNILNYTSRSNELNNAMNNAMIDTQRVILDKSYKIENSEEYIAEFTQNLIQYINSNSEITIQVYSADENTGLLDIGVISHYINPVSKKEKKYEVRRTSFIDVLTNGEFEEDDLKDSYYLTFSVLNNIKVDLSEINFFISKDIHETTVEIPLLSGEISGITAKGTEANPNISYKTEIKNGKTFLIIHLTDLQSDTLITIQ